MSNGHEEAVESLTVATRRRSQAVARFSQFMDRPRAFDNLEEAVRLKREIDEAVGEWHAAFDVLYEIVKTNEG